MLVSEGQLELAVGDLSLVQPQPETQSKLASLYIISRLSSLGGPLLLLFPLTLSISADEYCDHTFQISNQGI